MRGTWQPSGLVPAHRPGDAEPAAERRDLRQNDGILDNPYSLWTETIDADAPSTPLKIDEGYNGTYQLHPVEHALVWQQASAQVMVSSLAEPSNRIAVPGHIGA